MFWKENSNNKIIVPNSISKKEFFEKYGNISHYHEICEKCPIIDKIFKSRDYNLYYWCKDCFEETDNNSPLERLLFGAFLTFEKLELECFPFFQGDHHYILSPIDLQHKIYFDNKFSSTHTIIDMSFQLWKLVFTAEAISNSKETELKHVEKIWTEDFTKSDSQKEYVSVAKYAIYCDGHEFHERTKEQAKRDRSIDRKLQQDGWRVFRFTGSEIFNSIDHCIKEIYSQIIKDCTANKSLTFLEKDNSI